MRLYNVVFPIILAFASLASAQSLPFGQTLTQDGTQIVVSPFQPGPVDGVIISVAPANALATVIHLDVILLADGLERCTVEATVGKAVFTPLAIATTEQVTEVRSVKVLADAPLTFGVVNIVPANSSCAPFLAHHGK